MILKRRAWENIFFLEINMKFSQKRGCTWSSFLLTLRPLQWFGSARVSPFLDCVARIFTTFIDRKIITSAQHHWPQEYVDALALIFSAQQHHITISQDFSWDLQTFPKCPKSWVVQSDVDEELRFTEKLNKIRIRSNGSHETETFRKIETTYAFTLDCSTVVV